MLSLHENKLIRDHVRVSLSLHSLHLYRHASMFLKKEAGVTKLMAADAGAVLARLHSRLGVAVPKSHHNGLHFKHLLRNTAHAWNIKRARMDCENQKHEDLVNLDSAVQDDLEECVVVLRVQQDAVDRHTEMCQALFKTATERKDALQVTLGKKVVQITVADELRATLHELADLQRSQFEGVLSQLEEASAGLRSIDDNDLFEIARYQEPPMGVIKMMHAVCYLFRYTREPAPYAAADPRLPLVDAEPTWLEAKLLLQGGFLDKIKMFQKNEISKSIHAKVRKLVMSSVFDPVELAQASRALLSIADWVRSVVKYTEAKQRLDPLEQQRRVKEAEYTAALAIHATLEAEENRVRTKLRNVKVQMAEAQIERDMAVLLFNETFERGQLYEAVVETLMPLVGPAVTALSAREKQRDTALSDAILAGVLTTHGGVWTLPDVQQGVAASIQLCKEHGVAVNPTFDMLAHFGDHLDNGTCSGLVGVIGRFRASLVSLSTVIPLLIDPFGAAERWLNAVCHDWGVGFAAVNINAGTAAVHQAMERATRNKSMLVVSGVEDDVLSECASWLDDILDTDTTATSSFPVGFRVILRRESSVTACTPHVVLSRACVISFDDSSIAVAAVLHRMRAAVEGTERVTEYKMSQSAARTTFHAHRRAEAAQDLAFRPKEGTDFATKEFLARVKDVVRHRHDAESREIEANDWLQIVLDATTTEVTQLGHHIAVVFDLLRSWDGASWRTAVSFDSLSVDMLTAIHRTKDRTDRGGTPQSLSSVPGLRSLHAELLAIRHLSQSTLQSEALLLGIALAVGERPSRVEWLRALANTNRSVAKISTGVGYSDNTVQRLRDLTALPEYASVTRSIQSNAEMWAEYLNTGPMLADSIPPCSIHIGTTEKLVLLALLRPALLPSLASEYVDLVFGPGLPQTLRQLTAAGPHFNLGGAAITMIYEEANGDSVDLLATLWDSTRSGQAPVFLCVGDMALETRWHGIVHDVGEVGHALVLLDCQRWTRDDLTAVLAAATAAKCSCVILCCAGPSSIPWGVQANAKALLAPSHQTNTAARSRQRRDRLLMDPAVGSSTSIATVSTAVAVLETHDVIGSVVSEQAGPLSRGIAGCTRDATTQDETPGYLTALVEAHLSSTAAIGISDDLAAVTAAAFTKRAEDVPATDVDAEFRGWLRPLLL